MCDVCIKNIQAKYFERRKKSKVHLIIAGEEVKNTARCPRSRHTRMISFEPKKFFEMNGNYLQEN